MKRQSLGKDNKQKKNKGKKLLITFLLIICILVVLLYFFKNSKSEESQINKTIEQAFHSLKTANIDEVNHYLNYDKLVSCLDIMILENKNGEVSNLEKELFGTMEWKIIDIHADEEKIVAIIEMKNKDFKEILTQWIKEIVEEKQENNSVSKEFALNKLEKITKQTSNTKIVTKEILIKKQEDRFRIVVDNELRNLVYPGIESVATAVTKSQQKIKGK